MTCRILSLAILTATLVGCGGPALEAGETLVPADAKEQTEAYIAKVPTHWIPVEGRPTRFKLAESPSEITVLVCWNPSPQIKKVLEVETPEDFYNVMVRGHLRSGGDLIRFGDFVGVVEESHPNEMFHSFFGKHNISLTVQDDLSFILINARDNNSDITRQEVIDFAKSIRRP